MAFRRWWMGCLLAGLFGCSGGGESGPDAASAEPEPMPFRTADDPQGRPAVADAEPQGASRWTTPAPDTTTTPADSAGDAGEEGPDKDAFIYECHPGDTESCVTSCGSIGTRSCGKRWGECVPPDELCNDADEDCDGAIDEGVTSPCGGCDAPPAELCDGADNDCDGFIDEGVWNACGACGPEPEELCNQIDDDCDDLIDEGTLNACGACGQVPAEQCNGVDDDCDGGIDEGTLNACGGCGAPPEEVCNGADDDCDGAIDEAGNVVVAVNISGDCVFAACPGFAPFPVGCNIVMQGGDHRGCVASLPDVPAVYFQEGDQCNQGHVSGSLTCSCAPQQGLNANNCSINKPVPLYVSQPSQCP